MRGHAVKMFSRIILTNWWDNIDTLDADISGEFKRTFRMSRMAFSKLVDEIKNRWRRIYGPRSYSAAMNYPGGIRRKVAVCLHFLSLESGLRVTASQFGMSVYSVWDQTNKVIQLINWDGNKGFIDLPEEWSPIIQGFEEIAGVPDIAAAVDGTHVLVNRPESAWLGLYNRKGLVSINVQGVVDHRGRFISASVKPGACNDKTLWSDSFFGKNVRSIIPLCTRIVGDSIYSLRPWFMIPYPFETVDKAEKRYNYRLSKTRIIVERAFGWLKGKWRCLKHLRVHEIKDAANIVMAAMSLHNWVLMHDGPPLNDLNVDPLLYSGTNLDGAMNMTSSDNVLLRNAEVQRNALKDYLYTL
jgi:hypothetical protein